MVNNEKATEEIDDLNDLRLRLDEETKRTYKKVAETLYDNPELQDDLYNRLGTVSNSIKLRTITEDALAISELDLISINGLISKEERIRAEERSIQWIVPGLITAYIIVIAGLIFLGGKTWNTSTTIPLVGVPVSVVLWAAIGSLAAILHRFYTQKPERMSIELRWLIARPIIGIIMGSLGYLAITSGILIFSTSIGNADSSASPRPEVLWLFAFLGGFSDKFFDILINAVVSKVGSNSDRHTFNNKYLDSR